MHDYSDVSHLCFSQNITVLYGEALCGGEGVLWVLWKSGSYLQKKQGHLKAVTIDCNVRINAVL